MNKYSHCSLATIFSRLAFYGTITFVVHMSSDSLADEFSNGDRKNSDPKPTQNPIGEATDRQRRAASTMELRRLRRPVASFGAATHRNCLYVYGGHVGATHVHSKHNATGDFFSINLHEKEARWRLLGEGPKLQGACLVASSNAIYRIGGLAALNDLLEEEILQSSRSFAKFDLQQQTWVDLPDLPSGRSSHDAVFLNGKIYVFGGWEHWSDGTVEWHSTVWVYDLTSPDLGWTELPQPFERRALAAVAHDGFLYVIGGLDSEDRFSLAVDVFDPSSGNWISGPPLPGLPQNGFGPAACVQQQSLLVSCMDGGVYRLSESKDTWQATNMLCHPRYLHRIVPLGAERLLVLGGDSQAGHLSANEVVGLQAFAQGTPANVGAEICPPEEEWFLANPTTIRCEFSMCKLGMQLLVFGGSKFCEAPSDEAFLSDLETAALSIDLRTMQIQNEHPLPTGQKMMNAIAIDDESEPLAIGFGGITRHLTKHCIDTMWFRSGERTWFHTRLKAPQRRWMFQLVRDGETTYMFGGFAVGSEGDNKRCFPREILAFNPSEDPTGFVEAGFSLPQSRFGHAVASIDKRVFVVGGFTDDGELATKSYVCDLDTQQWKQIPTPAKPRTHAQLVSFKGKLYLAGGSSPDRNGVLRPNRSVEEYDPLFRKWTEIVPDLGHCHRDLRLFTLPHRILCVSVEDCADSYIRISTINPPSTRLVTQRVYDQ